MLQYTTKNAYEGNTWVETYNDGHSEGAEIVSNYELDGYIRRLEGEGYELSYDVEEARKKFEDAKREFLDAREAYLRAISNALRKSNG